MSSSYTQHHRQPAQRQERSVGTTLVVAGTTDRSGGISIVQRLRQFVSQVDTTRVRWIAFATVLTVFTLVVVQNTVVVEIRLLYFSDRFDSVETRLSTALIAAAVTGLLLGLLLRRGTR